MTHLLTHDLSACLLALACAGLTGCASPAGSPNVRGYELDIGENSFYYAERSATVRFKKDDRGDVTAMDWSEKGSAWELPKIGN